MEDRDREKLYSKPKRFCNIEVLKFNMETEKKERQERSEELPEKNCVQSFKAQSILTWELRVVVK